MSAFDTVTVVSYRSLLMLLCDLASSHVLTSRNSRPFAECPHRLPNYSIAAKRPSRQAQGSAEIGSASCRERVCQYVWISVVAVSLKKKKTTKKETKRLKNT